jgi:hypothetical protein
MNVRVRVLLQADAPDARAWDARGWNAPASASERGCAWTMCAGVSGDRDKGGGNNSKKQNIRFDY